MDGGKHEAVAPDLLHERLHLVRDAGRGADELGEAHALPVPGGHLGDRHRRPVRLVEAGAHPVELGLGPLRHDRVEGHPGEVEVEVGGEDRHPALDGDEVVVLLLPLARLCLRRPDDGLHPE